MDRVGFNEDEVEHRESLTLWTGLLLHLCGENSYHGYCARYLLFPALDQAVSWQKTVTFLQCL